MPVSIDTQQFRRISQNECWNSCNTKIDSEIDSEIHSEIHSEIDSELYAFKIFSEQFDVGICSLLVKFQDRSAMES